MTAPTPASDLIFRLRRLADSTGIPPVKRRREVCNEAADALAAVTAERDQERAQHEATKSTLDKAWDDLRQARQMLADAEKKIASMELDESLREEDERFADPL